MTNRLLLILCFILWCSGIYGQQERFTLSGQVTDPDGRPLSGASVVSDNGTGVASGNDGRYLLRGLRSGRCSIRFSFIGYEPLDTVITVSGDTRADISLKEALNIADEIIIRSSRAGSRTPAAHTTVDGEMLRKGDMSRDLPVLLSLTPSLVETSDAGNGVGYTSMRIRGTDASRINVTVDGIPLNDAESQQVFWVDLPDLASSASSIQVQRGVGTSSNGSGAFGASVNINTLIPPDSAGVQADFQAGSFSTFRASARAWTGMLGNRFNMMIRASHIGSDGYIDHSASDINSAMVTALWSAPRDRIRVNFLSGREKTGISWWGVPSDILPVNRRYNPAGEYTDATGTVRYYENETDNYNQNHYNLLYTHRFSPSLHLNAGLHLTTGLGYYEEQKSDRDPAEYGLGGLNDNGIPVTETDLVQRKWLDNRFYGAVWSLVSESGGVSLTAGGALNRYDGDHYGTIIWMEYPGNITPDYEWYRNNGLKEEASAYVKAGFPVRGSLSAFADLQYRYINYRFEGPDDDMKDLTADHRFSFFNPKAGLTWNGGAGSSAFMSVSVAHREPTRTDFKEAAGDPEATPGAERLTDFEGGYSYSNAIFAAGVNLYWMDYRDQLVPTGRISSTGYPVMTNVPSSFRTGVELSARYTPWNLLSLSMNMTVSRSSIRNFRNYYSNYNTSDWSEEYTYSDLGTVDIAYSPRLTGSAEAEIRPLKNTVVRLTGKYVGRQYFDNTMSAERAIDPYFFSNFSAEYLFGLKSDGNICLRLTVNNLFNTMYENNAYGGMWTEDGAEKSWAYYFPQAGTNFIAGISFTF